MLRSIRLHHLRLSSWALVIAGIVSLIAAALLDQSELFQLIGLLLVVCGVIKLAVVSVWKNLAHMETDQHDPIKPV
jgi:Na+-translocating ferredoxin:NAD+ oxidoreductase RnfA subunit